VAIKSTSEWLSRKSSKSGVKAHSKSKLKAQSGMQTGAGLTSQKKTEDSSALIDLSSLRRGSFLDENDIEIGERVMVIYRWGPAMGDLEIGKLPSLMISVGKFGGIDKSGYNLAIDEGYRYSYIPLGCIRYPGWIMRIL
jgi:hypothetical protein